MGFLEERDLKDVPTIPEYYKGKSVFITGGTGFMGKVLVEKLLYSCTDLEKIYLLLRPKKGVSPEERLKDMYSVPCFDRLRKERPGAFESKVSVVAGDIGDANLGLSPEDQNLIIKNVNIVFHVAASVRFDDHLAAAAKLNLRSTVDMVAIAKKIENLEALVHISTSYSNTNQNPVGEVIYSPHADWRDTLKICETLDEDTLRFLTAKYIGTLPNTYAFTKQLAEHVVYEQRGQLPAIIVRPSVVISSISEPAPGWVDNFNGPVGTIVGITTGIVRCLYSDESFSLDYAPVDKCIRHFIAAAWIRGTKKLEISDDVTIYNCCSNKTVTNQQLQEYAWELLEDVPIGLTFWTMNCTMTTSKLLYYVLVLFSHVIPALFVDSLLWLFKKKPMLLKLQRRIFVANMAVQKYLLNSWTFKVDNFKKLRSCLKEDDIRDFYYDFDKITTKEYVKDFIWGCKKYLLKEKNMHQNLPKLRNKVKRIMAATLYTSHCWARDSPHYWSLELHHAAPMRVGGDAEQSSSTTEKTLEQNNGTTNGTIDFSTSNLRLIVDLYLYIGAGVAVFIVIVIAQTFCIIRYRKRVANAKRTLDVVLCNQEEKMNDKSVRYSTGPELRRMVKNTKTNKNTEEEIYASIESLEDDIGPRPDRKAPQILQQSPNEMPDGYLEPITVKQSQTRPKLPLPHELEPSRLDVKEMPQMKSPSGTLQLRAQPPPISPKPRLPHPLQTPSFQPRPVLPPNFHPNFTPAVNVPRHSFAPTPYRRPTTDPRFQPLPPPPLSSITSSALDTSDEEWTYEKLPPFEAYLH